MIGKIADRLQQRYIENRTADGTAGKDSFSNLMFEPLKEQGLQGLAQGVGNLHRRFVTDQPTGVVRAYREFLFLSAIITGPPQFFLVVLGFKNRDGGNWQWYRDFMYQNLW